LSFRETF